MGQFAKRVFCSRVTSVILFFTVLILLGGCQKDYPTSPLPSLKHGLDLLKGTPESGNQSIEPIDVETGSLHSIGGWFNDDTLFYITDSSLGSNVYTHHLNSGEKKLLFESNAPIVSTIVSPSREFLLIHSAPSSNEAVLTVINKEGKKIIEESLPSFELNIQWNPYDESFILITAFAADWDFTVWNLNIEKQSLNEVNLSQPFAYWAERQDLLYLDWDLDAPSIEADLIVYDLESGEHVEKESNVLQVYTYRDLMVVIKVDEQNEEMAHYLFMNNDFEEIFRFTTPHLSSYSEWLIPFHDYNRETNSFLTYQPLFSSEADVYSEGFQLVRYDLETGKKEIILDGMDNAPISCSPNGKSCLTGFYYENLINLETKEILPLSDNS
ncbi:hypothetical protein ABE096_02735 [Robertmurraya massiliosenegalensis]|uniref:YqgU-like beta propeller domain-containing protein n=1 Tax=Robertmurraya TaxID=2837507 RepID=UPI0039A5DF62